MLEAEAWIGAARHKSFSQPHCGHHLRQRGQEMLQYREKPSRFDYLPIEVLVMVFGEIMSPAFKQSNNSQGGIGVYIHPTRTAAALRDWLCNAFWQFVVLDHCQLNSLSILQTNLGKWFKNPVFVECMDRFCHG